jgi:hypothetical protein
MFQVPTASYGMGWDVLTADGTVESPVTPSTRDVTIDPVRGFHFDGRRRTPPAP